MPRRICPRVFFSALALIGGMADRAGAAETAALFGVWQEVSNYLSPEALLAFKALPKAKPGSDQRERDFCAAVVQLDQQPLSETRLDDVEARLQALLAPDQRDEIDSATRYLLGRIAQIYRIEPDVALAADYYRGLIARAGPGHWVDLARVKLAVLTLYALPVATTQERLARAEALFSGTTDPLAVRDLHRLVARAMMFYNWPPTPALSHLLAADAIGGLTGTLGADQLVQIGELAWDTGDEELAKNYYDRLRREYPRDARIFLMDQRLAGNPVPQRDPKFHGR